MTIADVLRHRWTRWRRRTRGSRALGATIFSVLKVGATGLFFVLLGWFYPEIVAEVSPEGAVASTPLRRFNEHLLGATAGFVVARFFLQPFDVEGWHALLDLPVRRTTLAHALQAASAASPFTLCPLLGLGALTARTVVPAASPLGIAFWGVGALLALATTHFTHLWLRVAWVRRRWLLFVGASAVVLGLVGADLLAVAGVREASAWLFGGLQRGHVVPLLGFAVGTVASAGASTAALRRYTYDWEDGASRSKQLPRFSLDLGSRDGLSSLVLLERTLVLRNRGPREQILVGLGGTAFFVYMIVRGAIPTFSHVLAPHGLGLLLSIAYGQFAFAWHGGHFDGLLARVVPGRLVRAALVVVLVLAVGPLALAVPVVAWVDPFFAVPMVAFSLYHAGITVPAVVGAGILWNRRWVNPEQSRFISSGGPLRGMVLMALLSVPPALFAALGGPPAVLVGVAGLGGMGLGTASLWLPRLEAALRRRRHAMLRGFRGEWLSPHKWHW
jgi:hypothetical protein